MFYLHLFLLVIFISLFFIHKKFFNKLQTEKKYLKILENSINAIRYGNLTKKINFSEKDFENFTQNFNRMIETLADREKMIAEFQSELLRQNNFLEAIINSLSDGILILDDKNKILRNTPKINEWFNDKNDLIGKSFSKYVQLAQEADLENLSLAEIFIKDNATKNFVISTMKIEVENEKKKIIAVIKDITDQKELDKVKEDFVATLTHDMKVPIVAESNILEFLLQNRFGELTNEQKEVISNIQTSNRELNELVQTMLETYKLKDSGITLVKETIDINSLIGEIREEMRTIIEKSNLKLNYSTKFDFCCVADRSQLKRVIKNLIQNAVSHSGTAEFIDINVYEYDKMLNIDIKDYGKGISQDEIEKIFNKYYSTAKKFRKIGTGLGLYLSDQIVKAHNGKILVTSEIDKGSTFSVRIPFN